MQVSEVTNLILKYIYSNLYWIVVINSKVKLYVQTLYTLPRMWL